MIFGKGRSEWNIIVSTSWLAYDFQNRINRIDFLYKYADQSSYK